jgi:hypothetical protein
MFLQYIFVYYQVYIFKCKVWQSIILFCIVTFVFYENLIRCFDSFYIRLWYSSKPWSAIFNRINGFCFNKDLKSKFREQIIWRKTDCVIRFKVIKWESWCMFSNVNRTLPNHSIGVFMFLHTWIKDNEVNKYLQLVWERTLHVWQR